VDGSVRNPFMYSVAFTASIFSKAITFHKIVLDVGGAALPYILESNPHSVFFCDFLNGKKKLVCDSNPHLSFNRPLPTGRLIE
jgi:hypothetical protein